MLKLIGATLVIMACTVYGFYKATTYRKRVNQIKWLIYSLQRLKTYIQYGHTPLPEAFYHLSQQQESPYSAFFETLHKQLEIVNSEQAFIDIWKKELLQLQFETELKREHIDIIEQLGSVLGMSDLHDQQQHLQAALDRLALEENIAVEEQKKYATIWRNLGALTGVAMVILLI